MTCSFSTAWTPTATTCHLGPGSPGPRPNRGTSSFEAAPACSSTACRCAPSPTPCCPRTTLPILEISNSSTWACRRRRPARPQFPAILTAPVPQVTLVNLTTMQHDLQSAYSRQASLEVERQVGRLGAVSVGYSYLRGQGLLMAINQNVPSCVAQGTNNGCRPDPGVRQQQPVFVGGRVHLSRAARLADATSVAVGLLPCQLHALEVREQRR